MNKPDVKAKHDELERWVDDEVRPYLQDLLNQAQCKIRTEVRYMDGMGVSYIHFGDRHASHHSNWITQQMWTEGQPGDVFFRRFPELLEFRMIISELDSYLSMSVGDVAPTVRPRRKP